MNIAIEKEQKKNYYAIIPANVRYDDDLMPNAKLLYGEVTALCNEKGYCWATNEYFAELYGSSEKTITRWIKNLNDKGYIQTEIQTFRYEDGTVKKIRYIFIDKNVLNHTDKNVLNHTDKNVPYNNTLINNTINNKYIYMGNYNRVKLTEEQYNRLIEEFGKEYIDIIINRLDEYVESNNNKNKYSNYNLVIRKAIRENWFTISEKKPTWYGKEIKEVKATPEEIKELEERLKKCI